LESIDCLLTKGGLGVDFCPPKVDWRLHMVEKEISEGEIVNAEEREDLDEQVAAIMGDESLSQSDQIRRLHDLGFSRRQLVDEFHFSKQLVYKVLPVRLEGRGKEAGENHDDGLPVVRKMGQGVEVITPEAVLRRYMDGDEEELRGMMKMRAAMLMVMDLINMRKADAEAFALEVKPILDLMKETRLEQDAAAQRARASTMEAAREAAEETAARTAQWLEGRLSQKPDIAQSPHPMMGLFARMMERLMGNLMGQVVPGASETPPEGFEYRKEEGGNV
jgi:hypothetical protein